ncbi:FGGY family carbohydrate kinase [Actinomarinicola tropica]|uniref:ATP:glycerol 3-phosphotransferase n=1 Tax=Actinomarinicola tropica TaxID=2789776 RepID=A0A5Q2RQX9_9ACTN|nr:FGGY family carbohydrate kinase [Actinomarinicola tropica]QGG95595.1 glycerol kinase [Actinomarinicola tropica]
MSVLVIDVGTSGVRAAVVAPSGAVTVERRRSLLPDTPFPGLVEFDAAEMADVSIDLARGVLAEAGPVEAVGIANQRASTVVWDPATGRPVAPAIGWQDLRTVGECLALQADGFRLAPNHSATKLAAILDAVDPDRTQGLLFGTVDSWLAWVLTGGAAHVTDITNASVTGLMTPDATDWDDAVLDRLRIPRAALPEVVDSAGVVGAASVFDGAPPLAGIAGDQQASLIGQSCVRPGMAKITFGTGAMLDLLVGEERPAFESRGDGGTFPLVAGRRAGRTWWGLEAIALAAGSNVEWLRDDLGIIERAEDSHEVAAACEDTDGVVFVPALLGLGTPQWDYGARGTLLGVTRGTTRAHLVRAVLDGVAHLGADLVDAASTDAGAPIESLRVDGGMSANPTFVQALADACGRPIELSPVLEATTIGAGFLAALGIGLLADEGEIADLWRPRAVIEPARDLDRDRWRDAVERSLRWHPDLSGMSF